MNVLEDRLSDLLVSVNIGISEHKVTTEESKSWNDPHHQVTDGRKAESHESSHATEGTEKNDELGNTDGSTTPGSLSHGLNNFSDEENGEGFYVNSLSGEKGASSRHSGNLLIKIKVIGIKNNLLE